MQDQVAKEELSVVSVKGEENVADGLTKHEIGRRLSSTWRPAAWCDGVVATSFALDLETVSERRRGCV